MSISADDFLDSDKPFDELEQSNKRLDSFLDEDTTTPRLVNDQPEGIAKRAYRSVRESGPVTAIFGPDERQRLTQGVPDENGQLQYKPQGSLIEQKGLIPGTQEALSTPLKEIPKIQQQQGRAAQIAAGVGNVGIGFANFMQSPLGVATLGLGGEVEAARDTLKATDAAFNAGTATAEELALAHKHAVNVANAARGVSGAFAADMASNVPGSISNVGQAIKSGTAQDITEAGVGAAANLLLTGASAKHAFKGEVIPKSSEPEVTKAAQDAVIEAKPAESVEVQDQAADKVADHTAEVAAQADLPETASVVAEMAKTDVPKADQPAVKPDLTTQPEAPLTAEAQDLLSKVDAGGVPAMITRNLQRIAEENGVKIEDSDTPADVIAKLRNRAAPESRAEVDSSTPATSAENTTAPEASPSPEVNSSAPVAPEEVPPVQPEAPPVITPEQAYSSKNAYTDAQRKEMGLPPAAEVEARGWDGIVRQEADAAEAKEAGIANRIISEIADNPRPLKDYERLLVLREQIRTQAEYDAASKAVVDLEKQGDPDALAAAKSRLELARDRAQDVFNAERAAGRASGQSLAAIKQVVDENFNLIRLETRARAEKGEALTEVEANRIKAARDEWVKAKEASDKVQEQKSHEAAQEIFDRVLHEIRKETQAAKDAKAKGSSSKEYWQNLREQALERERERRSRTYAIDPVSASPLHLKDEAIIGASYLAENVIDFGEWSKRMISDLGEEIRPRLPQIYDRSKAYHDQINKEFETKAENGQKTPKAEKTPGQVLDEAKVEGGITKKVIFDLARAYVRQGDSDLGSVMDKVTKDLKPLDPTLDPRKVRDIFSDYGKVKFPSKEADLKQLREFRALAQAISALEDIQKGKPPERSGMQRDKPTQKVRELQRKIQQALKEFGIETVDPSTQLKTSLDRIKTSLRNQIEDLQKQIDTGEKTPKKNGVAYDQEAKDLKARRDALREHLQAIEGKTEMSDEQRNKLAIAAAKRSLDEYNRRIKELDFSDRQKPNREPSPELAEIRAQRDAAREAFETLRDGPKKDPDQVARERLLKAINKRADALEEKLRTHDYGKTPKKAPLRDEVIDAARAREQRAKDKVNEEIEKIRLDQRTKAAKAGDFFVKVERAMKLSSLATVLKLAAAAAVRVGVSAPIEQGLVRGIRQVPGLRRLANEAPNYTPIGMRAYAEAATRGVMRGIRDFKTVLKTGRSDLDILNGKKTDLNPIMLDWFGNLHGALKNPVKQAAFEIAYKRLSEFNLKRGIDIQDPAVMADMAAKSYLEAKKSIFMQDNLVTDQWQTVLNMLDKSKKYPDAGPWVARGLRFLLPIVKVPTNIVGETLKLNPVSLTKGLYEAGKAIRNGLENVPSEQKNHIIELLAKGSLGTAMMALGYYNPDSVGGYYQHQEKRKPGDVKAGGFKLFGHEMPHWMFHAPIFEVIQMGATIRRVADSLDRNRERKGVAAGVIAASIGLAKEQPFLDEIDRIGNALNNETERRYFAGSLLRSTLIPPGVQQLAAMTDKKDKSVKPPQTPMQYLAYPFQEPVKRKPSTLLQHVEMGIPYLRQNVPEKH